MCEVCRLPFSSDYRPRVVHRPCNHTVCLLCSAPLQPCIVCKALIEYISVPDIDEIDTAWSETVGIMAMTARRRVVYAETLVNTLRKKTTLINRDRDGAIVARIMVFMRGEPTPIPRYIRPRVPVFSYRFDKEASIVVAFFTRHFVCSHEVLPERSDIVEGIVRFQIASP